MSDSPNHSAPDAEEPRTMPAQWSPYEGADESDELFLGAEAVVPPRDFGPPIPSRLPEQSIQRSSFRELEKRVRATLSPAFPLEVRRMLPGAMLLRGYRDMMLRTRSLSIDEFGRDEPYCQRVRPAIDFLYKRWLRVSIHGVENIPRDRAAILVCNHNGALPYDATMLMHGLTSQIDRPLELRPLLEDSVFHLPYLGVFLRRLGAVRACQENAMRLLNSGKLVAVFPEGHKAASKSHTERNTLRRFGRGGFVKLALRSGAPLVPVAIVAHESRAGRLIPNRLQRARLGPLSGGLLPAPGRWTIIIGEATDLSTELPESGLEDRTLIADQSASIRSQIQEMINNVLVTGNP